MLAALTGCAGIMKGIQEAGYLDGVPNLRNKDIEDIAQLAEAFGLDPAEVTLGQFLAPIDKPDKTTVTITREDLQKLIEAAARKQAQ